MRKLLCLLSFALAVAFAPIVASAQSIADESWRVGFSLGKSRMDFSPAYSPIPGGGVSYYGDTSDSFKVLFAYRQSRHFGFELGYVDFGDFTAGTDFVFVTVNRKDVYADAVGFLPVGDRFDLFGKLGTVLMTWKAGIGAEYRIQGVLGLRVEVEQVYDIRNRAGPVGDIRMVSLGVTFPMQ